MKRLVVAAVAIGFVAACGKSTPSDGALPTEQAPVENSVSKTTSKESAPASASQMQMEAAAPKVNCSGVKGQVAPEGQPADDILGIRRGLELERVRSILNCTNSGYMVNETDGNTQVQIDNRMRDVPTKYLVGDNGLDRIAVQFVGLPGQEKVVSVGRSLEFAEGNEKLFTALLQEVEGKYGVGTKLQNYDMNSHTGMLLFAGDGQRVGESNSRFNSCTFYPNQSRSMQTSGRDGCGLTIVYQVTAAQNNNTLARKLDVVIIDQRQTIQDLKDLQAALDKQQTERAAESAPVDL